MIFISVKLIGTEDGNHMIRVVAREERQRRVEYTRNMSEEEENKNRIFKRAQTKNYSETFADQDNYNDNQTRPQQNKERHRDHPNKKKNAPGD